MTDLAKLARLLVQVADDLESLEYRAAPVIRRAAQELAAVRPQGEGGCPQCGGPVVQPTVGRRRMYCGRSCRDAAYRRRNGALVA